jgi:hypothetical protein
MSWLFWNPLIHTNPHVPSASIACSHASMMLSASLDQRSDPEAIQATWQSTSKLSLVCVIALNIPKVSYMFYPHRRWLWRAQRVSKSHAIQRAVNSTIVSCETSNRIIHIGGSLDSHAWVDLMSLPVTLLIQSITYHSFSTEASNV